MVHIIEEPSVPFVGPIKGGFEPGSMVRIQGKVPGDGDRFNINLHCGSPPSNIALHVSVRVLQSYIARNSFEDGDWGDEESSGVLPIGLGQHFEIIILCDPGSYKIAVNGNHFCEFRHRISFKKVTHLEIDGTVALGLLGFESAAPAGPPPPPPQRMVGSPDMPPGYGPPPPLSEFGYGPSPPNQGPFGGGPGRYPHHPPGKESGFDSFLGTAGTALASAMVSGLAENLLGGLSGQSQRHSSSPQPPPPPPPNSAYNQGPQQGGHHQGGHYQGGSIISDILEGLTRGGGQSQRHSSSPQPPPAYNQGPHQGGHHQGGSIIGDILGGLSGGGGQTHYQNQPQNPMYNQGGQHQPQGGQHQQQGGSIVDDILGSLASEMLKPSRRN